MKYIAIILAIFFLLFLAWFIGALPSDEEVERGQMMKIQKQIEESRAKGMPENCWSYPEFTGREDCI